MLFARFTLLAAVGLLLGCTSPTGDCAEVGIRGIDLQVLASQTGESLHAVATVTVRQLEEPLRELTGFINGTGDVNPLSLSDNRPGTYEIIASAPSYETASAQVTVRDVGGYCGGIRTEQLVLRLHKQP